MVDTGGPLISAHELCARLEAGEQLALLDVRYQLGRDDGHEEYVAGHLPGAVFVDLETALAGPAGSGGRHPLPDDETFAAAMRRAGVSRSRPVVVYDGSNGMAASRAWWLLRHHRHPDVRLLDGGLLAWRVIGGAVEEGEVVPAPGDLEPEPGGMPVLDADGAARTAHAGVLVDARASERFRGEVEPIVPVAGHVPGAVNVPMGDYLDQDGDGVVRLAGAAAIRQAYAEALARRDGGSGEPSPVGVYCGSGVTAAHGVMALEVVGVSAALYVGSWSEWCRDPSRPVATGD